LEPGIKNEPAYAGQNEPASAGQNEPAYAGQREPVYRGPNQPTLAGQSEPADAGSNGSAGTGLGESAGAEHDPADCLLVSETLARIGDKWTVLVVEQLCAGRASMRFNEIRRSIDGISQRMLTLTLRSLERDGLVTRTVHPTIPPRVDYALTELGRTLRNPLVAVAEWARANRPAIVAARKIFDATSNASPSSRQLRRRGPALLRAPRTPRVRSG